MGLAWSDADGNYNLGNVAECGEVIKKRIGQGAYNEAATAEHGPQEANEEEVPRCLRIANNALRGISGYWDLMKLRESHMWKSLRCNSRGDDMSSRVSQHGKGAYSERLDDPQYKTCRFEYRATG